MDSTTIKDRVTELEREFGEIKSQHQILERRGRKIQQEIRNLQNDCSHKKTYKVLYHDVAEMKLGKFCQDCGKQL